MGLIEWCEERVSDIGEGLSDAGGAIVDGVENVAGAIEDGVDNVVGAVKRGIELHFADGSRPSGEDPAKIYQYFHSGNDTTSYQMAEQAARELNSGIARQSDVLHETRQALSGGWSGAAADATQGALAPLGKRLDGMSTQSQGAAEQIGGQVSSFGDTKNKVVQVAAEPPRGGGLAAFANPMEMIKGVTADASVAAYQAGTQANQHAYTGYNGATTPQTEGLPVPEQAGPERRPDTSVDRYKVVDPGDGGGPAYDPYRRPGGDVPGVAGPGPGGPPPGGGMQNPPMPGGGDERAPGGTFVPDGAGRPREPAFVPGGTSAAAVSPEVPAGSPGGFGLPGGGSATGGSGPGSGGSAGGPVAFGSPGAGSGGAGSSSPFGGGRGGIGGPLAGGPGGSPGGTVGGRTGTGPGAAMAAEGAARPAGPSARGPAGMPMAGVGAQREEDTEHQTAAYLVHEEHGNEIVGDVDPVAPPVIGED